MNKKIFQLIVAMFFVIPGLMAQSVLLQDVTDAVPGTVGVDLSMIGFTDANSSGNLGAVTIKINYDPDLISYTGMKNINTEFAGIIANETNGLLRVSWFATSVYPDINGVLATLEFDYTGGIVADLVISSVEIANVNAATIPTDFSDQGSITPSNATVGTITVGSTTNAMINAEVSIPVAIVGNGLTGNSFTLNINFDPAKLTYLGATAGALASVVVNPTAAGVSIVWNGTQDFTTSQIVSNLNFTYLGGGEAAIDLAGGSMLTTDVTIQNMAFVNGSVSNAGGTFTGSLDIGEAEATLASFTEIEVPITAAGVAGDIANLSLVVAYDSDYVSYQGYTGGAGLTVTQELGEIHIFRTDYTGFTISDGELINLLFDCDTAIAVVPATVPPTYLRSYVADVVFNPGCIVQTDELDNVNVEYLDGSITFCGAVLTDEPVDNTIAYGDNASFTVVVENACYYQWQVFDGVSWTDITDGGSYSGATTANLTISNPELAEAGYLFRCMYASSTYTDEVSIVFTDAVITVQPVAQNVDAGSNATFTLTATGAATYQWQEFDGSSWTDITDGGMYAGATTNTLAITGVTTAIDGYEYRCNLMPGTITSDEVALTLNKYTISGKVKYANTTGAVRPINTNATSTTQVILFESDGITEIARVNADSNGDYSFNDLVAGDYVVSAETTKEWGGFTSVTLVDYAITKNFVNNGSPIISGLFFIAADVNSSTTLTLIDYAFIKNYVNNGVKASGWSAPDWIFEAIDITILTGDVLNTDIRGICSGDVNASYTPNL